MSTAFPSDAFAPVYYKQFLDSTPDVSAFADILNERGISSKKYTVIADKGFAAEEQFEALTQKNFLTLFRSNEAASSWPIIYH